MSEAGDPDEATDCDRLIARTGLYPATSTIWQRSLAESNSPGANHAKFVDP